MFNIELPFGAKQIIDRLEYAGFSAYVVGGCVRDSLLGLVPKDWDICTSATPSEVMTCFPDKEIMETGIQHSTVVVVLADGQYEVTTYRTAESVKRKGISRHLKPGTLDDDLSCRDFTINAMAYNHHTGLVDLFGGQKQLKLKQIDCVGDPCSRFREDPLRILRALRFSSVYGFEITAPTAAAVRDLSPLLSQVSAERIQKEFCGIIDGKNASHVLMQYKDILSVVVPEIKPCIGFQQHNPYHIYDVFGHTVAALRSYNGFDLEIKLALFFHDIGKPICYTEDADGIGHFRGHWESGKIIAGRVMRRLRFDNKTIKEVQDLIFYHDMELNNSVKSVRRWLNRIGEDQLRQLIEIKRADICAQAPATRTERRNELDEFILTLNDVLAEKQCFSYRDLEIDGNDLLAMGIPQGRKLGYILRELLDEVIDGQLVNRHEDLLAKAQELAEICKAC